MMTIFIVVWWSETPHERCGDDVNVNISLSNMDNINSAEIGRSPGLDRFSRLESGYVIFGHE